MRNPDTNVWSLRQRALLLPLLSLSILALAATPAWAADDDPCSGRRVRSLGGAHAVLRAPLGDLEDLQKRLPELEAGMREMIAEDPSLGAGAADALIAAIRAGAVGERKLDRNEAMQWMVYQPKRGELARIAPPCVELKRDYDAFEITVEVPEPVPVAANDARCELAVTRHCQHTDPTITLDLTGSSSGAAAWRAGQQLTAEGSRWAIADPAPCSLEQTFTVTAAGTPPPPHTARVYRFLIPKVCSNLAYLGEAPRKVLAAAGPPATCEKTVTAAQCEPWGEASVDPQTIEVHDPVAVRATTWSDCVVTAEATHRGVATPIALDDSGQGTYTPETACWGETGHEIRVEIANAAGSGTKATASLEVRPHDWTLRAGLAHYAPRDGEQERDISLVFAPTGREQYEVDSGFGLSLALEKRLNGRWGIEGAALFGRTETSYELTAGGETGEDDHNANFYAFTVGPNLHLLQCKAADLYVGLFAGYGGLADPNYWVFGHHFHADLSGEFVWGAQIGVDVPFSPSSRWGFHAGARYFALEQETDAGKFDVDPLIVQAGLSYRF